MTLFLASGCARYDYNGPWPDGSLRETFEQDALNFIVLGDWGRKGGDYQQDVANELGKEAARDKSRFIISTGDNFYNSSVTSTTDAHWTQSFEDVYSASSLQVPWYVVLGNHDYRGNIQAEVDYSKQSDRWKMPVPYFTMEQVVDDTTQALFIFLDTTPLVGRVFSEQEVAAAITGPAQQLHWLDSTLTVSDAEWKLVVGHHPLFAVGDLHEDNHALISNLRPILERGSVQTYISGHAHSLQHLHPAGTVDYFISGAGSRVRSVTPNAVTQAAIAVPGFMTASLTAQNLRVQFVDFRGKVQYQAVIERPDDLAVHRHRR